MASAANCARRKMAHLKFQQLGVASLAVMAAFAGTKFRKKVLHIAFEPQLHGVQRRLMETSGYDVLTVLGDNGLHEFDLAALAVDVVVVDCSAPFEQRWGLVRALKLNYPEIPVIALRQDTADDTISLADHNASLNNPAEWLDTIRALI